jgi:hypothetical protein
MVPDEARAVLKILDLRAAKQPVTEADWSQLFATEGYVRLAKRELSMKRKFDEGTFRTFVMSDDLLAKRELLRRTLDDWLYADVRSAASLALAYLPPGATIRAKIYPVIKPQTNSFVFEMDTDPAIFMYVGDVPRARFETTIAHEMHHVGYDSACGREATGPTLNWISAFGEGLATLAAAGGPDRPAQANAEANVQDAWQHGLTRYEHDFRTVETFFLDSARDLSDDERNRRAFEFFGLVGPWYTVGWKMAVVIEKTFGRAALIDAFCDQRQLLSTYNRAAAEWTRRTGEKLPMWSQELLNLLARKSP